MNSLSTSAFDHAILADALSAPPATPADLAAHLRSARARQLLLTADFAGERLLGPQLAVVNPPLWEIGHVAWFQERWCLRLREDGSLADSILSGADALYDSSAVVHATRWTLPLPDIAATRRYAQQVLERVLERLDREGATPWLGYFIRLSAYHEDMHNEAFHYTRQTLGDVDPFGRSQEADAPPPPAGDAEFAGGEFQLGAERAHPRRGFVFDNEKWAHPVRVAPFRMARSAVTNAQFLEYVEAGGRAPRYWTKQDGVWLQRRFQRMLPLAPEEPVVNVSWEEADAWCRWAGRRLPTEAEWEFAACSGAAADKPRHPWGEAAPDAALARLDAPCPASAGACAAGDSAQGLRQLTGNVWEWTASDFLPYPGFQVDPYKEYSEPWFGTRKVLRGGSFATPARLIRNTWRNFFTPERGDIFAGFRTCARED